MSIYRYIITNTQERELYLEVFRHIFNIVGLVEAFRVQNFPHLQHCYIMLPLISDLSGGQIVPFTSLCFLTFRLKRCLRDVFTFSNSLIQR